MPRTVVISTALLQKSSGTTQSAGSHPAALDIVDSGAAPLGKGKHGGGGPLIEEILPSSVDAKPASTTSTTSTALPGLKGILKKPLSASSSPSASSPTASPGEDVVMDVDVYESAPLEWDWTTMEKDKEGRTRLKITVRVPGLVSLFLSPLPLQLFFLRGLFVPFFIAS